MSSHHIVRENQEPALLIEDLSLIDEEDLGQLLEWSPTIVIEEETIDLLDARGYKFDIVFTKNSINGSQENLKLISYGIDFLKVAIEYLIAHHYKAVNIVTEQLDINYFRPYLERINIVLFSRGIRYYYVTTGFTKWKPAGERIQIEAAHVDEEIVHKGLIKISKNEYEMENDGLFVLQFSQEKYILIGEKIA
ncbi:MAG: thiamine pyrophosphokinase [Sphingobacterium sp.]|jgi:thiamine pyrophosphokinase|uniref:thiamine pyrophosphokinase n=1 Tax=Sphingobacterium sp. TaxID=341027 RepID=UPI00283A3329|nr:thiamine pyrophosphokinase [Sphingobacterium sp.]MDR0264693.1 thiamine pyrophosphokinase [Sphingobacterium sp.]